MPLAFCSVEARDAFQHPTMRGTAPTTKNDLNQNVSSVKVEKPRYSVIIAVVKTGTMFSVLFVPGTVRGRGVCVFLLPLVGFRGLGGLS